MSKASQEASGVDPLEARARAAMEARAAAMEAGAGTATVEKAETYVSPPANDPPDGAFQGLSVHSPQLAPAKSPPMS